jgi:hypothetical protein
MPERAQPYDNDDARLRVNAKKKEKKKNRSGLMQPRAPVAFGADGFKDVKTLSND